MIDPEEDRLAEAARRARTRDADQQAEPSLGARLGQIGVLGWMIVVPTLLGAVVGHAADRYLGTGIFFSAPLIMLGAVLGFWSAGKWMHRP